MPACCFLLLLLQSLQPPPPATTYTWKKLQYLGGAIGAVAPEESWKNKLTISPSFIDITLANGKTLKIPMKNIAALSYAGHRRVNGEAAGIVAAISLPASIVVLALVKSTDHYLGIEYLAEHGRVDAILLRLHKDNYREIVDVLEHRLKLKAGAVRLYR